MLVAKYKTGSSLYLTNTRDNDFLCFYETDSECHSHPRGDGCAYSSIEREQNRHWFSPYRYLRNDMELIEGEDIRSELPNIYGDFAAQYKSQVRAFLLNLNKEDKLWYHILAIVYIYTCGYQSVHEFTEPQLNEIQKIHDERKISDWLYNYVLVATENW